jgi:hypothetical protein
MAPPTYPNSDLDRSSTLMYALGTFWSRTYEAADQVRSYAEGTALQVAQAQRDLLETVATLSRYDVPLYHTEHWTPIVLRKSQRNSVATNIMQFNKNSAAFDDGRHTFDSATTMAYYAYPLPENMAGVAQIFNKLIQPTLALVEGVDYLIDINRGALIFINDPFDSPETIKKPVSDRAKAIDDEEIVLWGFQGKFDYAEVYNQFAYAINLRLRTSQGYKDLTNAVISGLINGGATAADLDLALSAICDVPVARERQETVELVRRDARGLVIATDRQVYRFGEDAEPLVAVGDALRAGDRLVRAFDVVELNQGGVVDEIAALALDAGYLSACFYGDLVFENKSVPLEVNTAHPLGYTYVQFRLGGFPLDAQRFFDEIHERGVQAAEIVPDPCDRRNRKLGTLAHLLDRRKNPDGEPTAANLPKTINPLKFIVENVLRNNVFLVQIRVGALGQNRLGLYNIRHLRQLLPPQSAMIVIFSMQARQSVLSAAQNLQEAVRTFTGAEPLADVVYDSMVRDANVTVRRISGTCQ